MSDGAGTGSAGTGGRRRIAATVTGVVQGVGFRPFVYRTATAEDLGGSVKNLGDAGVAIDLEGDPESVDAVLEVLREDPPPLARVDTVAVEEADPVGEATFTIEPSAAADQGSGSIPPDTGICERCLADVRSSDSRYYGYWATACVDCGPRFTVIRELPYDRERTSMDAYPFCPECQAAYEDPADRRYHAQTTACPNCGPRLRLVDLTDGGGRGAADVSGPNDTAPTDGATVATGTDAITAAMERVAAGDMIGIKGTGGTHVACEATDPAAVGLLRERFERPSKPFALMAPTVEAVQAFATPTEEDLAALSTIRRPIVTVEHDGGAGGSGGPEWLDAVAPGLHTVGVMLPYAGLHHLLFDARPGDDPLVMTSANMPGEPMATTTEELLDLEGIDAALVHDRDIVARCDDSVVRTVDGRRTFLRRSRGWVPGAIPAPSAAVGGEGDDATAAAPTVLATGGEFDATVAISRGEDVVPSQHVGDVDGPDALAAHRDATDHLLELFDVEPDVLACDLHPEFLTTGEAERRATALGDGSGDPSAAEPVRVQHHHAHAAALLGEHDRERGVVIAVDGSGYGPDGTIWGGEVLDTGMADYERVGGLAPFGLPGGEAAVRYPARILPTLLDDAAVAALVAKETVRRAEGTAPLTALLADRGIGPGETTTTADAEQVRRQVERGVNCPTTTSAGRYLDAVAALLGVCRRRDYEGQPAMELEATAAAGEPLDLAVPFTTVDDRRCVDTSRLLDRVAGLAAIESVPDVAATAQVALADGLSEIAVGAAEDGGGASVPVGVSGGVAVNDAIVSRMRRRVTEAGGEWLAHERLPPGDGGLAYGQAVVALARH